MVEIIWLMYVGKNPAFHLVGGHKMIGITYFLASFGRWVYITLVSSLAAFGYIFFVTSTITEKIQDIDLGMVLIVYTLMAYFSLYVAQFLNRLNDFYYNRKPKGTLSEEDYEHLKKILDDWAMLFLAHVFFTTGIIVSPGIVLPFLGYCTAVKFGFATFCAGYAALAVMSAKMAIKHFSERKLLESKKPSKVVSGES